MEYELPQDQERLEQDIDQLFAASDEAAFLILSEIVDVVRYNGSAYT